MDRKKIREYQLAQLSILEYFDNLCSKLTLDYYLVCGTLLGAIRHKGFIPWDADVDVAMYRNDYEKLKHYFIQNPNPTLFYQHYETEKHHMSPHAILRIKGTHVYFNTPNSSLYQYKHDGIYIDIFPIDVVPDDKRKQLKQINTISRLCRIITLKAAPTYGTNTSTIKKHIKTIVSKSLAPLSFKFLMKKIDEVMKKYNGCETNHVGILADPSLKDKLIFPKEVFSLPQYAVFEGKKFKTPNRAEEFLLLRYGDYMQLPPVDERWTYLYETIKDVDFGNTDFLKHLKS